MSAIAESRSNDRDGVSDVSTFRLYLLRAAFLLIAIGLGSEIWPVVVHHPNTWTVMHGVAVSLLAALSALAALDVRYPLQMLPLMLFELLWKSIWLTAVALPLWLANQLDVATMETVYACLMGIVICPVVIPWSYVLANYVVKGGDRWW